MWFPSKNVVTDCYENFFQRPLRRWNSKILVCSYHRYTCCIFGESAELTCSFEQENHPLDKMCLLNEFIVYKIQDYSLIVENPSGPQDGSDLRERITCATSSSVTGYKKRELLMHFNEDEVQPSILPKLPLELPLSPVLKKKLLNFLANCTGSSTL